MEKNYSKFITINELQQELDNVSSKKDVKKGGIPLYHDDKRLYIDSTNGHSLIIGSTGSGKTQSVSLPKLWTSIMAEENIIVDDIKGEMYDILNKDLTEKGYRVYKFDFKNYEGNKWNPLKLAFELYKNGNIDDAVMIIEKTAYYIFREKENNNSDPFWINSVMQLFCGLALYIMEKEDRIPSIYDVANYASKVDIDVFNKLDENSPARIFLKMVMTAPKDTNGSIYAVFNNMIMCYAYKNKITDFISDTDFEFNDLLKEKTALIIVDGHKKQYITNLVALFIEEFKYICEKQNNKRRISVLIDDFNDYVAIESFGKLLADSRSVYIEFTILTSSFHKMLETYGETSLEHIISQFNRIIYLFANDEYTLDYISNMCGNKSTNEKLISTTELKLLEQFEVIVLKNRHLPFKTKLLPFYQYSIK